MTNNSELVLKIKNLLELASNNPSEAEASTAMNMARRLMMRHNLTEADLKDSAVHNPTEYGEKRTLDKDYLRIVGHIVREMTGVTMVYYGTSGDFRMVGRQINILVAEQLLTFLCDQVEHLYKIHLPPGLTKPARAKFRKDFKRLCAYRIFERAQEEKVKESTTGTELVAIDNKLNEEVDEFLESKGVKVVTNRKSLNMDSQGGRTGYQAGNSASLRPTLEA
jgi:hypothetical protein